MRNDLPVYNFETDDSTSFVPHALHVVIGIGIKDLWSLFMVLVVWVGCGFVLTLYKKPKPIITRNSIVIPVMTMLNVELLLGK